MNLLEERLANSENYVKAQMALMELAEEAMGQPTSVYPDFLIQMDEIKKLRKENVLLLRACAAARRAINSSRICDAVDAHQEFLYIMRELDHA
jgi:hypothetical protein